MLAGITELEGIEPGARVTRFEYAGTLSERDGVVVAAALG